MDVSMTAKVVARDTLGILATSEETRPVVVEWLLDPQDDTRFDAASCAMCGCGCS